jgi:hypothetical protein
MMSGRMQLTQQEEVLAGAFRRLPPAIAGELTSLAERLAEHAEIDWSDAWSQEDVREYSAASALRVTEEPGDGAA